MNATPGAPTQMDAHYYHVAAVVEDLDAAMSELHKAIGVRWGEPHESKYGDWAIRVVYSLDPPFLELVEGEPGGPWDTSSGPHLDHIGYFSDDVGADSALLRDRGLGVDVDPIQFGHRGRWVYHLGPRSGLRIELVTSASRAAITGRGS
jgi:hypothetical protein